MYVTFDSKPPIIHKLYVWNYAYRDARKGKWMQAARDRDRFRRRIEELSRVITPILQTKINLYN